MIRNFAKGMVIGGLIGASISLIANPDIIDPHMKKKMVRSGRKIVKRSNHVLGEVIDLFR